MAIKTIQGTHDILPGDVELWQRIENAARRIFSRYGFAEIRTPIFEWTDLFSRSIGAATDIVQKEMYSLPGSKGRSMTLRPEGTAPVVRSYLQHKLGHSKKIERLYYIGQMFRHERPQKGRYRQFHQIGAEVIGSESPAMEAEILHMLTRLLSELGLDNFRIVLNSVGDTHCRPNYLKKLQRSLSPLIGDFCNQCQARAKTNPLRILDCKITTCQELVKNLPKLADSLCDGCITHHQELLSWLDEYEINYHLDETLVRGLDYYVRTTFEIITDQLGPTQNAILGGGRYDGLSELLGGPRAPGYGFALGLERLVLLLSGRDNLKTEYTSPKPQIFLAHLDNGALRYCVKLAAELRDQGIHVLVDYEGRSLKSQMRLSDRLGSAATCVIGETEITSGRVVLRRMRDGKEIPAEISETGKTLLGLIS